MPIGRSFRQLLFDRGSSSRRQARKRRRRAQRSRAARLERLEDRRLLATCVWGAVQSGDFGDANNWLCDGTFSAVPGPDDVAIINASGPGGQYTVNVDADVTVGGLRIDSPDVVFTADGKVLTAQDILGTPNGEGQVDIVQGRVVLDNSVIAAASVSNSAELVVTRGISQINTPTFVQSGELNIEAFDPATLIVGSSFTNTGAINLSTSRVGRGATIAVADDGVLTNNGVINDNSGIGGPHSVDANVINNGVVNVSLGLTLDKVGAQFVNNSQLNIASGTSFNATAGSQTIVQASGALDNQGSVNLADGSFDFTGGAFSAGSNPASLTRTDLSIGPGATGLAKWSTTGDSQLSGDLASDHTLTIGGPATVTATDADEFVNAGTINMSSFGIGQPVTVVVPNSTFRNTGVINPHVAILGPRSIVADFINDGVLNAGINDQFANTSLVFDKPGGQYTNNGQINIAGARDTVSVAASAGTFTQADGVINNLGSFTVAEGAFELLGGAFTQASNPVSLTDSSLVIAPDADGLASFKVTGATALAGDVGANHTLNMAGPVTVTATDADEFVNAGTINMASSAIGQPVTLLAPNSSVRNVGVINAHTGINGARNITADFVNEGTLNSGLNDQFGNTSLVFDKPGGQYTNYGQINIAGGRDTISLPAGSGMFTQAAGIIDNRGNLTVTAGSFKLLGGAFSQASNAAWLTNADLEISAEAVGRASFTVTGGAILSGDIGANHVLTVAGTATLTSADADGLTNLGTMNLTSVGVGRPVTIEVPQGVLRNEGLINTNSGIGGPRNFLADVVNNGVFQVSSTVTFEKPGATFVNNGDFQMTGLARPFFLDDSITNSASGVISGIGRLEVNRFPNNGAIQVGGPGDAGTLTIGGQYVQSPSGRLEVEVGGTTAGSQYDQFIAEGGAEYQGQLAVATINDFVPVAGTEFTVGLHSSVVGDFDQILGLQIGDADAFSAETRAASIVLTAGAAADLVALSATAPATVQVGQPVTISYTAENRGNPITVDQVVHSIYASTDGQLSPDDVLVAQVTHAEPADSYDDTVTALLPTVPVGELQFLAVIDSRRRTPDINRTNNVVATTPATLTVPQLPLGETVNGSIADGQDLMFELNVAAGSPVRVIIETPKNTVAALSRFGQSPSPQAFDQQATRQALSGTQEQLIVELLTPQTGREYIELSGLPAAAAGSSLTITAVALPQVLTVDSLSIDRAGNEGQATTTINGRRFSPQSVVKLIDSAGVETAASVRFVSPEKLSATVDLTGLPAGVFDVSVEDHGDTATLADAFTVTEAQVGELIARLTAPSLVRRRNEGTILITYENPTANDMVAPLLALRASDAGVQLHLAEDSQFGDSNLLFLGVGQGGDAGVLAPGERNTIEARFAPGFTGGMFDVELTQIDPASPVDWESVKDEARPESIPADAWEAIFQVMQGNVGDTAADLQAALAENATQLAQQGTRTASLLRLLALEIRQANPGGVISQRYRLGPLGRGVPDPTDVSATTDAAGNVTIRSFDAVRGFQVTSDGTFVPLADGSTLTKDASGAMVLRMPGGALVAFHPDGRFDYSEDRNGGRTTAAYSGGQLSGYNYPNGESLSFAYNAQGRIIQASHTRGPNATYTYDLDGEHLESMTTPLGTTSFTYVSGQGLAREHAVESVTYPDGSQRTFQYDDQGRASTSSTPEGQLEWTYDYDALGNVTVTNPAGDSSHVQLNEDGLPTQILDAAGQLVLVSYEDGLPTATRTPGDSITTFTYDDDSRQLTRMTDPLGNVFQFDYDPTTGFLAGYSDPNDSAFAYEYDGAGNVVAETWPTGASQQFGYDERGNVTQSVNRRAQITEYTWDIEDRLTRKTLPDQSIVDYTYDIDGNLSSLTDDRGTIDFSYNDASQLTGVSYPDGRSLDYTYDEAGRLTSVGDHWEFEVQYNYDPVGRLAGLSDADGQPLVAYTYDEAGNVERIEKGNGTSSEYFYDTAGRIVSVVNLAEDGSIASQFDYDYDEDGRQVAADTPQGPIQYEYDAAGRLTSVVGPSELASTYEYDAAGNVKAIFNNLAGATFDVDALGEVTGSSDGGATFEYDLDGNLVSRQDAGGLTLFEYDFENRLTLVNGPDGVVEYQYDALGNRIAEIRDGERRDLLMDPTGTLGLIGEYDAAGNAVNYFSGVGLAGRDAGSGAEYYSFDGNSNTVGVTDPTGAATFEHLFLPMGQDLIGGPSDERFTFAGQQQADNVGGGMYLIGGRPYDSTLGRYSASHPGTGLSDSSFIFVPGQTGTAADTVSPLVNGSSATFTGFGGDGIVNRAYDPVAWPSAGGGGLRGGLAVFAGPADAALGAAALGASPDLPRPPDAVDTLLEIGGNKTLVTLLSKLTGEPRSKKLLEFASSACKGLLPDVQPLSPAARPPYYGSSRLDQFVANHYSPRRASLIIRNVQRFLRTTGEVFCDIISPNAGDAASLGPLSFAINALNSFKKFNRFGQELNKDLATIHVTQALDPNEMVGPAGVGPESHLTKGNQLPYDIHFENLAGATAAAQEVFITHTLDSDLDFDTFELGDIAFGDTVIEVPDGRQSYETRLELSEPEPLLLDVIAEFDRDSGLASWTFRALDPTTLDLPPLAGFLPPNVDGVEGTGVVSFSVSPRSDLATGDRIDAQASIVFDVNDPIDTPPIFNTIDDGPPASSVDPLPAETSSAEFTVSWAGQDDVGGSGVAFYDVYVSVDQGPFQPFLSGTTDTSAVFVGEDGRRYGFYSVATDNVGLREPAAVDEQAFTVVSLAPTDVVVEIEDRGSITGGAGNNDLVQIVVTLAEAIDPAVEADFDAYQAHLNAGHANVPFELTSLGITLSGFERLERLLSYGTFRGVYVNPVVGANSSQTLTGTSEADLIVGLGGNDTLIALGGNDIVIGGPGNDSVDGGEGNDFYLYAGSANGYDSLIAGPGVDQAVATEAATVIGVNGYDNGVDAIDADGHAGVVVRDTNASRTLDFSGTELRGIAEVDAAGGNDTVTASDLSDATYRGGSGNDSLTALGSHVVWLYSGGGNGYDQLVNGTGTSIARAEADDTTIGVNGFDNGVDAFDAGGHASVVVRDTNASRTLDFSGTELLGIAEVDGAGGNDTVTASDLSDATYRGGPGNDSLTALGTQVVWLYSEVGNGFDQLVNGTGTSTARAETDATTIGVNGFVNGVDSIDADGHAGVVVRDTNASRTLDFSGTELLGIAEVDAAGGNDTVTASDLSDATYRGGSGNDSLTALGAHVVWLYAGGGNGYDQLINGTGTSIARADADNTTIGVNGFDNGVDSVDADGHANVIIRDTNASRTLDFSQTELLGIAEVNAAGGNDIVTASDLSDANYRGGSGNDALTALGAHVVWLYSGGGNGFDQLVNGAGTSTARADADDTTIGVNGFDNGVDTIDADGHAGVIVRDTNASRTLDFSQTEILGILLFDAAGGNDTIIVSTLSSGTYQGGSGNDRFVVQPSASLLDIALLDFLHSGQDRVDLGAFGFDPEAGLSALDAQQDDDDTLLALSDEVTLRLIDFALGDLDEADFLF